MLGAAAAGADRGGDAVAAAGSGLERRRTGDGEGGASAPCEDGARDELGLGVTRLLLDPARADRVGGASKLSHSLHDQVGNFSTSSWSTPAQ